MLRDLGTTATGRGKRERKTQLSGCLRRSTAPHANRPGLKPDAETRGSSNCASSFKKFQEKFPRTGIGGNPAEQKQKSEPQVTNSSRGRHGTLVSSAPGQRGRKKGERRGKKDPRGQPNFATSDPLQGKNSWKAGKKYGKSDRTRPQGEVFYHRKLISTVPRSTGTHKP